MRHIFFTISFLFLTCVTFSQIVTEADIRNEILNRGLTEQEVFDALKAKGIDVNTLDLNNPADILKHEKTIREVIFELEKKKKEATSENNTASTSGNASIENQSTELIQQAVLNDTDIKEAVKEGATVEEAISEEIVDIQSEKKPKVRIYGHQIFTDNSIKLYRTSEDAKAPDTYILGVGDKVSVSIWGDTERNFLLEVTSDGYIKPESISRIYVKGLTIKDVKELLYKKLRQYFLFNRDQIDLNLITARTINVNIVGEVFNQGSFSISALNTALNALIASGGPTELGTVRNILIKRSGEKDKVLDVYQYLQNPEISQNFYLQENDFIYVPIREKIVSVNGEVNRPGRYELKNNENLDYLVKMAGGLTPLAITQSFQIERTANQKRYIIDELYSPTISKSLKLEDQDMVHFQAINEEIKNFVSIAGDVKNPGRYELKDNMKIVDLVNLAEIRETSILDTVFITRTNPADKTISYIQVNLNLALADPNNSNNILLNHHDHIKILSKTAFTDEYIVSISGEVRLPGEFPLDYKDLSVADLIFLSGGLSDDASNTAYIYRKNNSSLTGIEYIYFNPKTAYSSPNSEDNKLLQPKDKINVINKNFFKKESFVTVNGAVKKPDTIAYDQSLSLKDAIILSGGLKQEAAAYQIDVFRLVFDNEKSTKTLVANVSINSDLTLEGNRDFRLMPFDQIEVRSAPEFEFQQNVLVSGEVKFPGTYALVKDNTTLSDIIKQTGGLTNEAFIGGATLFRTENGTGYVIVDFEKALKNRKDDVILIKGDRIIVPKRNTLVSISGATNANENYAKEVLANGKFNVAFESNKNAKYYIDKYAGGFDESADKGSTKVIYPNGQIKKSGRFLFWRTYPEVKEGSQIVVGYKKSDKEKSENGEEKEKIDWGVVLKDSVAQATAILSLVLLLKNIN
ncbi:MAG TPA: SLBB domain-containing protein [Saprospiraceae bacterium]|nr:SLBB domain-containing protein [Saprospiraceae bacterium]HPQ20315.1 SLBB domain-containing protein [Saprospiraceae bacterium]